MKKHLKKIRNRSDEEKTHLARTLALTTTILVAIGYIVLSALLPKSQKNESPQESGALQAFSEIVETGFNQVTDLGKEIKQQVNELPVSPEMLEEFETEIDTDARIVGEAINEEKTLTQELTDQTDSVDTSTE